jgi:hypothetical protein
MHAVTCMGSVVLISSQIYLYSSYFGPSFILHQGQKMKCFASITSALELDDVVPRKPCQHQTILSTSCLLLRLPILSKRTHTGAILFAFYYPRWQKQVATATVRSSFESCATGSFVDSFIDILSGGLWVVFLALLELC